MKNLVLKTVIMTFTVIITVIAAIYACFAIFSPKTLAKFWEDAGSYSFSIKYYEKQYEKSGDISDLANLCAKLEVKSDSERAVKYFAVFTDSEDFSAICEKEDKAGGYAFTSYEYYYGSYAVASYYNSGIASAISVAKKAISAGYTEHNAFFVLLSETPLKKAEGESVAEEISAIKETLSGDAEGFAERDIIIAQSIK